MELSVWVPCWFKIKVNCGVKTQAEFITDAALKNFQPGLSERDHLPSLLCSDKNDFLFSTVAFCKILWHILDAQISLRIISLENLTQLLRWKEHDFSTPYILSVCWGKCEILPVQGVPVPPALYQVCVCCSTEADLALWLWWCGMSCFGLPAEFHRGFLNKITESDLLPSISC